MIGCCRAGISFPLRVILAKPEMKTSIIDLPSIYFTCAYSMAMQAFFQKFIKLITTTVYFKIPLTIR